MKEYLILLLFFFLTSCNSKEKNTINLFNNYSFEILEIEQQIEITQNVKNDYFAIIKDRNVQIPIYRHIKNSDYVIYIGIPVNTSLPKMIASSLFNESALVSKTDSISYNFKKYKKEKTYITEYIVENKKNILYVLAVTESETISKSTFGFKKLSQRINLKK